eukprot:g242.t1
MFIRNFFIRTFIMDDMLKKIRALLLDYQSDPNNIGKIRVMLNEGSRDIILLSEILEYLNESLVGMIMPEKPEKKVGQQLYDLLDVQGQLHDVTLRCQDLMKLVHGAQHELSNLQQMTDVINTRQLEDVFKNVEANTKYLVDASVANERASASLEIMQIILAGSFAFDILDRLSGGTLNITVPTWVNTLLVNNIIKIPMLWFILNMLWLIGISAGLLRLMRYLASQADGALTFRVRLNMTADVDALRKYLSGKKVEVTDSIAEPSPPMEIRKSAWVEVDRELWKGEPPKIEVQFDNTYSFILVCVFTTNRRRSLLTEPDLLNILLEQLRENKVVTQESIDAFRATDEYYAIDGTSDNSANQVAENKPTDKDAKVAPET